jgi:hypothetical protein
VPEAERHYVTAPLWEVGPKSQIIGSPWLLDVTGAADTQENLPASSVRTVRIVINEPANDAPSIATKSREAAVLWWQQFRNAAGMPPPTAVSPPPLTVSPGPRFTFSRGLILFWRTADDWR